MSGAAHEYAHSIKGVEIFKPGKHNGDVYTTQDLDDLAAAAKELDYTPALKQGHVKDETGLTALGWVQNVRREGDKLVADFVDLPDAVYDAIRERKFDRVSSEIFWNFKRADKTYRRALKAVALLGTEIPAVAGLRPLHQHFAADAADEVHLSLDAPLSAAEGLTTEAHMSDAAMKELQDRLAAAEASNKAEAEKRAGLEAQLAALNAGGAVNFSDAAAAIAAATLNGDVKELAQRVAAAEADAKKSSEENTRLAAMLAQQDQTIKELARNKQEHEIEKVVGTCRIPAFRPFVRQFLEVSADKPDAKLYAIGGRSVSPAEAVAAMITWVNENAARVFTLYSKGNEDIRPSADAGKEVDERARKYMESANEKDYARAVAYVLSQDTTLKQQYLDQRGGGSAAA